ncbi:MAG: Hsp20/alpha crystallin family protein [Spirochaetales bacterium]|nr:Hsp20/alpha crystallin family protein [Spirochaetales bacterium]MDY5916161.1 Hsp20/alpha crystallin family protein [Treponema sp.]
MNELALFNDLFDGFEDDGYLIPSFNFRKAIATPKVDVKEEKDSYLLEMDLPGKTDNDINIELDRNVLTISSQTKSEKEEKAEAKTAGKYLIKERSYSKFSRSFTLPEDVDSENLSAKVTNGVLTVTMPRKAIATPKRIAITAD